MILFLGIVHLALLAYCLQIKIGKHRVSFSGFLWMESISMLLLCILDGLKVIDIPTVVEVLLCGCVIHLMMWVTYLHFYAKKTYTITPDLIFVFGAGLIENRISLSLKTRLNKAYELSLMYPKCPMIVSGGQGKNEWLSEAEAMKKYLIEKGVDESKIWLEDKSTTTWENLTFSMQLYDLKDKKIALVSNQFHMYRVEKMAKKLGLEGYGMVAHLHHMGAIAFYIREYFAFFKAVLKNEI